MQSAREVLESFELSNLPDLDVAVIGALELLSESKLPTLNPNHRQYLVIGSVNALSTGKIIFNNRNAIFASESNYLKIIEQNPKLEGVVLVSASGGKHAIEIAKNIEEKGLDLTLLTNNPNAPAKEFLSEKNIIVFPKNREPYTYNTSTYLSMILASTGENPKQILSLIESAVKPKLLRNFGDYNAVVIIVPPRFELVKDMFRTKFDELFGPRIVGRVFTSEEIKHAKTVVSAGDELLSGLGVHNEDFGLTQNRINISLSAESSYGEVLAVGYYLIGQIQKSHPPYFKNSLEEYTNKISKIFNQDIKPIVE